MGKHDVFDNIELKTGNEVLDCTFVGAFNEVRNAAALGVNFVFNLLGTADDVAWETADYTGSKIGIIKRGEWRDDAQFRQFVDAVLLANGKGIKRGSEVLIGKLDDIYDSFKIWRNSRRAKVLYQYHDSKKSIFITQGELEHISDDAFVRFDPTEFNTSISELGIQKRFFEDKKVWLLRYKDAKKIFQSADLEKVLYRQNLWKSQIGKFKNGATLRLIKNVNDAKFAGKTNLVNGVKQWRILRDVDPSDLVDIYKLD